MIILDIRKIILDIRNNYNYGHKKNIIILVMRKIIILDMIKKIITGQRKNHNSGHEKNHNSGHRKNHEIVSFCSLI